MIIEQNKVAILSYTLKSNNKDGDILETIDKSKPLEFVFGKDSLLAGFENRLKGLKDGETFEFTIPKSEAYGPYKDELIIKLSKQMFSQNGVINEQILTIGNKIPMMDSAGRRMNGTVREVNEDSVKMDFNHPLAGKDLYFSGEIKQVRDATEEELNPSIQHTCGCGTGTKDESCCSSSNSKQAQSEEIGCGCGNTSCGC